jgi:ferric iron reductase protein FhuF
MLSGRWVPDLAPGNVLVQLREGSAAAIALRGGEPRPIEDDRKLAAAAHAAVVRHVEPVIDALVARRLRGRRALWRAAGDRVGQAFLWCAAAFGAPARARRLGTLVLAPPSPMHVPLRVATGEDGVPYHPRASCCLWHRVPPGNLCPGCPLHNAPRRRVTPAPGRSS